MCVFKIPQSMEHFLSSAIDNSTFGLSALRIAVRLCAEQHTRVLFASDFLSLIKLSAGCRKTADVGPRKATDGEHPVIIPRYGRPPRTTRLSLHSLRSKRKL